MSILKSTTRHHPSIILRWVRCAAVSLLIATATWHCGQTAGVGPDSASERKVTTLDRDGDGQVSRAEFPGPAQRFGALDADGDEYLSARELRGGRGAVPSSESASADRIPIIDAHVHLDVMTGRRANYTGAAETALETMDRYGIQTAVIMSPPLPPGHPRPQDYRELLGVARKFAGRFLVLAGGATLNPIIQEAGQQNNIDPALRKRFLETAETMLAQGAAGFGELTSLHFSFNSAHPFEMVRPDHPLFLLLANVAARHRVPIDLHMEAVLEDMAVPKEIRDRSASNPARIPENISSFERLLDHNRKAMVIWQHAGWDNTGSRSVQLMRRLLDDHSNLFLALKMSPLSVFKQHDPVQRGTGLRPEWRALIAGYPERFVLGSDYFAPAPGFNRRRPRNLQPALRVIELLPAGLKRKVAYENARRLYRLDAAGK